MSNALSRFYAAIAFLIASALPLLAHAVPGTVRLKNGGWIEGDLTEVLPGDHVSIRRGDGVVQRVPWAEVARVDETTPQPEEAAPIDETTPQPGEVTPHAEPAPRETKAPSRTRMVVLTPLSDE